MKHVTVLLAALVLVVGVHSLTRADAPVGMQKWEYKVVLEHGDDPAKMFDDLGKDGWEYAGAGMFGRKPPSIFKRPVK